MGQGVVVGLYLAILSVLCLLGAHRLWLAAVVRRPRSRETPPEPVDWPFVTVQLPVFDERHVVERLIAAAGALDYPHDRLQIQVLDDSTDDTTARARAAVDRLRAKGVDAVLLHRSDRAGFKAGALAAGLVVAKGELIAIFDADFVPSPDFLRRTVPWLRDGVGLVQARWGHLDPARSWLSVAQATQLDGHFVVEHGARDRLGRWFNFNGTAGVWRRAAIEAAGGWSADTLTEDLDLSYRAQLAGWRFVYLDDVVAPAELPPTLAAFKSQQHRWARGSVQTARKLLRRIWAAPVPLATRLEATFHLTANAGYPLAFALSVLLPFEVVARAEGGPLVLAALDLVLFGLATGSAVVFYAVAIRGAGGGAARIARIPVVLALGLGMAVAQTWAVLAGLFGPSGSFVRTPKRGAAKASSYRVGVHGLVWIELVMAAYLGGAVLVAIAVEAWPSLPFLLLFAGGYAAVGLGSLREAHQDRNTSAESARVAGPQVIAHSHSGSVQVPAAGSNPSSTA